MSRADRAGVSVRWLVDQRTLGLTVLTGDVALDRRITWAHSIELADPSPWLRGGELVLTTGLRLPADAEGQHGYVAAIAQAGAAAIGFGVGLSHDVVPPAVVAAARDLELPLLEVPLPTPFVAVVRTVTERLAELQYEGVVRASRVQPRMARAALRRGIPGVLKELAAALGGEAAMVDRDGRLLSGSLSYGGSTAAALEAIGPRLDSDRVSSAVSASSGGVVSAQSVRVGRHVHGHLVVVTPGPLTPADHFLVGHAASLIALEQEKPLRLRDEQARIRAMLLSLLLDGAMAVQDAARRLATSGFPADEDMAVLAVEGMSPPSALVVVDEVMLDAGVPHVALERGPSVVAVVPGRPADLARGVVDGILGRSGAGVGIGHTVIASAHELAAGIDRALAAARSACVRELPVVDAATLGGHALTTDPATRLVLSRVADTTLGPLIEHDRRAGTDLIATLRAFLEHHGQVESTASFLHIHRHTLRARMTRIQNTINADLNSAHVRAELLLALTIDA